MAGNLLGEVHAVDLTAGERVDRGGRNLLGILKFQLREEIHLLVPHLEAPPGKEVAAAPANQSKGDLPARRLRNEVARRLDDVGVEAAAQAAIRSDHEEEHTAFRFRHRALVE